MDYSAENATVTELAWSALVSGLELVHNGAVKKGRSPMPHYVSLLRYTAQGIAKVKESPSRLDAARKVAESMGGKVHSWWLTMGHHDAVLVAEFPSDEACAKFMLSVGSLGNITTQTLRAFSEAEYRKIIGSLP
jgi:uncharacterized protein with GYD domain